MKRGKLLQEVRIMRFEEAYYGWTEKRLTQEQALITIQHVIYFGSTC